MRDAVFAAWMQQIAHDRRGFVRIVMAGRTIVGSSFSPSLQRRKDFSMLSALVLLYIRHTEEEASDGF